MQVLLVKSQFCEPLELLGRHVQIYFCSGNSIQGARLIEPLSLRKIMMEKKNKKHSGVQQEGIDCKDRETLLHKIKKIEIQASRKR